MSSLARFLAQRQVMVRLISVFMLVLSAFSLRATTVVPPEFEELVRQSDYVVRARVAAVESRWEERGGHRMIMTFVTLEVLEAIAGDVPERPVLQMLGGQVGEQKMILDGAPQFTVGDEDILFVQGNGRQVSPLTAMMHGRYRILREAGSARSYVTRENGEPLTDVAQVAQPLHRGHTNENKAHAAAPAIERALTPASFISRIRAVKPISAQISDREQLN